MEKGLVSIITPAYNAADTLERTIQSILVQTYPHWELLVVDDFSPDANVRKVVENYACKDERIHYFRLAENSGAGIARNKGVEQAQGEYIAFCDADDVWMPEKLKKQIAFMENHDYAFTCTSYEKVDEAQKQKKIIHAKERVDYNRLLLDNPVGNSTAMYSVAKLGKHYSPPIRKRNDYGLWLQILKETPYVYGLDEVLTSYTMRSRSLSSNKLSVIKYHWILYRDIEHLGILRSLFHIFYFALIKVLGIK